MSDLQKKKKRPEEAQGYPRYTHFLHFQPNMMQNYFVAQIPNSKMVTEMKYVVFEQTADGF